VISRIGAGVIPLTEAEGEGHNVRDSPANQPKKGQETPCLP
jgi:hypothetical protein